VDLSQELILEVFFTHCKRPLHKRYQNVFNAECPVCKEGKSAGRTRRLFYFPNKNYFYCHNCSKSWRPLDWIKEVSGLTVPEIIKKNKEKSNVTNNGFNQLSVKPAATQKQKVIPCLPENSINLSDASQITFYQSNSIVQEALNYCNSRRLFTAVNKCKTLYLSLEDKVHKNRLVIPFFDQNGKIVCYQTRSLFSEQTPKYLTKFGEKRVFGIDNVNEQHSNFIFIFEGPIDSMFVKNGVAIAALSPTESQLNDLNGLIGYEHIYVFDNDKNNQQTKKRIEKHIRNGKRVFIWPSELKQYKDINQICCRLSIDEFPWQFIVKHSACGQEAILKHKLMSV
jgi:hypothetical protein